MLVNERGIQSSSCSWRAPNIILVALLSELSNLFLLVSGMNKNAVLPYDVTGCTIALYRLGIAYYITNNKYINITNIT